jgi:ribosomal protein S18 acetylase RimI-like enzyme
LSLSARVSEPQTLDHIALQASHYTIEQLAHIYNESRVDYIVPMPMNARRLEEYVRFYDIDLSASIVAQNAQHQVTGIGMLGLRESRTWITRLGVIPDRRGRKIGQFMMEGLLEQAQERRAQQVQLEVIEGNEPAYNLFMKLGFEPTRKLLVVRRPPGLIEPLSPAVGIMPLDDDNIHACLNEREPSASWIDETPSLLKAGNLEGLRITLSDGTSGWIVFRNALLQITHIVVDASTVEMAAALLQALHTYYPRHDTKLENLPADSLLWHTFQHFGYCEAFTRIEMARAL